MIVTLLSLILVKTDDDIDTNDIITHDNINTHITIFIIIIIISIITIIGTNRINSSLGSPLVKGSAVSFQNFKFVFAA